MFAALAPFLIAITGTLAARVMVALGIGVFSYAALNTLASSVVSAVTSSYSGMGAFPLAIVNLAGGSQVFAILTAAIITRASLMAVKAMRPI